MAKRPTPTPANGPGGGRSATPTSGSPSSQSPGRKATPVIHPRQPETDPVVYSQFTPKTYYGRVSLKVPTTDVVDGIKDQTDYYGTISPGVSCSDTSTGSEVPGSEESAVTNLGIEDGVNSSVIVDATPVTYYGYSSLVVPLSSVLGEKGVVPGSQETVEIDHGINSQTISANVTVDIYYGYITLAGSLDDSISQGEIAHGSEDSLPLDLNSSQGISRNIIRAFPNDYYGYIPVVASIGHGTFSASLAPGSEEGSLVSLDSEESVSSSILEDASPNIFYGYITLGSALSDSLIAELITGSEGTSSVFLTSDSTVSSNVIGGGNPITYFGYTTLSTTLTDQSSTAAGYVPGSQVIGSAVLGVTESVVPSISLNGNIQTHYGYTTLSVSALLPDHWDPINLNQSAHITEDVVVKADTVEVSGRVVIGGGHKWKIHIDRQAEHMPGTNQLALVDLSGEEGLQQSEVSPNTNLQTYFGYVTPAAGLSCTIGSDDLVPGSQQVGGLDLSSNETVTSSVSQNTNRQQYYGYITPGVRINQTPSVTSAEFVAGSQQWAHTGLGVVEAIESRVALNGNLQSYYGYTTFQVGASHPTSNTSASLAVGSQQSAELLLGQTEEVTSDVTRIRNIQTYHGYLTLSARLSDTSSLAAQVVGNSGLAEVGLGSEESVDSRLKKLDDRRYYGYTSLAVSGSDSVTGQRVVGSSQIFSVDLNSSESVLTTINPIPNIETYYGYNSFAVALSEPAETSASATAAFSPGSVEEAEVSLGQTESVDAAVMPNSNIETYYGYTITTVSLSEPAETSASATAEFVPGSEEKVQVLLGSAEGVMPVITPVENYGSYRHDIVVGLDGVKTIKLPLDDQRAKDFDAGFAMIIGIAGLTTWHGIDHIKVVKLDGKRGFEWRDEKLMRNRPENDPPPDFDEPEADNKELVLWGEIK